MWLFRLPAWLLGLPAWLFGLYVGLLAPVCVGEHVPGTRVEEQAARGFGQLGCFDAAHLLSFEDVDEFVCDGHCTGLVCSTFS
jgi:hypothetical protein